MVASPTRLLFLASTMTLVIGAAACTRNGEHGHCCDAQAKAAQHNDEETETVIQLADLPAKVRTALASVTIETNVTKVKREVERGMTTYDVEYTKDGQPWSAELTSSGALKENEREDGNDDHAHQ